MERICDNQMDIIDAVSREHTEDNFQDLLADLRCFHWGKRQAYIIHSDRYAHSRIQLCEERIASEWMI